LTQLTAKGGFVDSPQRINVALTRARNHLIILVSITVEPQL
jgi:superfamily I DNA and/or RNA helicase